MRWREAASAIGLAVALSALIFGAYTQGRASMLAELSTRPGCGVPVRP